MCVHERACARMCTAGSDCHVSTGLCAKGKDTRKRHSVKRYRQTGARLEHLERVDDPLVVRAEQGTDVLAWGVAQPLGHAGPAPLLAHHLKAAFIRHHLQRTSVTIISTCNISGRRRLVRVMFFFSTFERLKRSRMRRSMCGIFKDDA